MKVPAKTIVLALGFATLAAASQAQNDPPPWAPARDFKEPEKWSAVLDKDDRAAWQKPDQVIDALKLPKDARVADIGAGTGYFSVRLARRLPDAKIFAADAEPKMVDFLSARAKRENLSNMIATPVTISDPKFPEPLDLALFVNAYGQNADAVAYYTKLRSQLKPDGRVALILARPDVPMGPPKDRRPTFEKCVEDMQKAGFTLAEAPDFLPRQFFAIFKKSAQ
ncbi:MAG: trans-aconitate 2-methyltransferase [Methylocystis sp.]